MSQITFITGGCRSGKSVFAEEMALKHVQPSGYIATAQAFDHEMQCRIEEHKKRRGEGWVTFEEPHDLTTALERMDREKCGAILVDCVTIWLSNLLLGRESEKCAETSIMTEVERLLETLLKMKTPVFLVSNEVGMGIVPENKLGRVFRDIAGVANQRIASIADQVWMVVSGIPVRLK